MGTALQVVIIENSDDAAAMLVRQLEAAGYTVRHTRVATAAALRHTLENHAWDIILTDYALSDFSVIDAITIAKAHDEDLPLIIVSNAVGEEKVVAAMKAGAVDFFTKGNLGLLASAVAREVQDAQHRRRRKSAELELRQSEQRFSTTFHANPIGMVLTSSADGRVIDVNDQFLQLSGYTRAQIIGMNGVEIGLWVSDAQRQQIGQLLQQQESLKNVEVEFRYGTGEHGVALLSTAHIELDGEPCVFSMVYDITDRKISADRLGLLFEIGQSLTSLVVDNTQQLYSIIYEQVAKRLFDAPHLVIAQYDQTTQLITCEFAIVDHVVTDPSLFPPREMGAGPISDAIRTRKIIIWSPAEELEKPEFKQRLAQIGDEQIPQSGIYIPLITGDKIYGIMTMQHYAANVFQEKDISLIATIASQVATVLENAHLYRVVSAHVETLEQRVRDRTAALERARDRAESILTSTGDVIVLADQHGNLIHANPAFNQQFHHDPQTLVGQPLTRVIDKSSASAFQAAIHSAMNTATTIHLDAVAVRRDNTRFEAEVTITPLAHHAEHEPHVVCVIYDVSRYKETESSLRRALETERQLSELKMRFSSMVSHEFRNPLSVILSSVGILKSFADRLPQEKKQARLDAIENQVHRLVNLLDRILMLSRAESIQVEITKSPIIIEAVCRESIEEIQQTTTTHILELTTIGTSRPVELDAHLVGDVIRNLLTNAVKYSPAGGPIHIHCRYTDAEIILAVTDQGIGIPMEDQQRLFEAFHRAGNAREIAGTGLGLAIVAQAVQAHAGTVHVESTVGAGSTFTLTFPAPRA